MRNVFIPLAFITLPMMAQTTDKVDADNLLFETLSAQNVVENYHAPLDTAAWQLLPTDEKGLWRVAGNSFQVKSLSSDYYVERLPSGAYRPIASAKHPMETAVNLLLNRLDGNRHRLNLIHHQYGGKNKTLLLAMQAFYDALARQMDLYCSVQLINRDNLHAILVMHHPKRNYIHMLELDLPTQNLLGEATITAQLYSNIPQDNIKSLFKTK